MSISPVYATGKNHCDFASYADAYAMPPKAAHQMAHLRQNNARLKDRFRHKRSRRRNFMVDTVYGARRYALSLIRTDKSIAAVHLDTLLSPDFHFADGEENYISFSKRRVELPMCRAHCATFVLDALHEISHSQRELAERLLSSPYEASTRSFDSCYSAERPPTKEDLEGFRRELVGTLEEMKPELAIARERRNAMLALLHNNLSVSEYLSEEDVWNARSEQEAWRFANSKIEELENQGFDFAFPSPRRESYVQSCLMAYDLSMLRGRFFIGGMEAVRNSSPVYVTSNEHRDKVMRVIRAF